MKILIVLAAVFLWVECSPYGKPELYWRDYNRTVPADALQVFMDETEALPVYIEQGYLDRVGLLPGMLLGGSMDMVVSYRDNSYTISDNVKIMATHSAHPDLDFQWIPNHFSDLYSTKSLPFLNVPNEGTAGTHVVYIERLSDPAHRNIGQVNTIPPYEGLNIPNPKIPKYTVFRNFEFLALLNFDCDEKASENSSEECKRSFYQEALNCKF